MIRNELNHSELIQQGLKRVKEHQAPIGTLLAWIHNEGIRHKDVYFPAHFMHLDTAPGGVPEIKKAVEYAITQLQRANEVLV